MSGRAASGAVSRKSMKVLRPSANCMVMKPPPPRLPAAGYTTASAYPTATAASMALPPLFNTSTPMRVACACAVTTMPFCAATGAGDAA